MDQKPRKLEQLFLEDGYYRKGSVNGTGVEVSLRGTYILECLPEDFPSRYAERVAENAPTNADAFVRCSGHELKKLDGSLSLAMEVRYYKILRELHFCVPFG